ncbi:hypothetical protein P153DRAFT_386584 [Dothidotthia symphoricarpi CBS 119687]|uniref:Uncharacterized protein n=1 Tax=Dothidotthia symphoricarpi CBS 119687 TaxID=1392245 RepID=A0A6A6A922_9PLEO|nr:uncharacterized protein P153DRAFT_386584 [Dothidotthia symphoricarpi CBS 119687]KAF2128462.1 hypothetical protein P153DRAFT_386584 [Dothidotthia symphoricarpi CBS 119687]
MFYASIYRGREDASVVPDTFSALRFVVHKPALARDILFESECLSMSTVAVGSNTDGDGVEAHRAMLSARSKKRPYNEAPTEPPPTTGPPQWPAPSPWNKDMTRGASPLTKRSNLSAVQEQSHSIPSPLTKRASPPATHEQPPLTPTPTAAERSALPPNRDQPSLTPTPTAAERSFLPPIRDQASPTPTPILPHVSEREVLLRMALKVHKGYAISTEDLVAFINAYAPDSQPRVSTDDIDALDTFTYPQPVKRKRKSKAHTNQWTHKHSARRITRMQEVYPAIDTLLTFANIDNPSTEYKCAGCNVGISTKNGPNKARLHASSNHANV